MKCNEAARACSKAPRGAGSSGRMPPRGARSGQDRDALKCCTLECVRNKRRPG